MRNHMEGSIALICFMSIFRESYSYLSLQGWHGGLADRELGWESGVHKVSSVCMRPSVWPSRIYSGFSGFVSSSASGSENKLLKNIKDINGQKLTIY